MPLVPGPGMSSLLRELDLRLTAHTIPGPPPPPPRSAPDVPHGGRARDALAPLARAARWRHQARSQARSCSRPRASGRRSRSASPLRRRGCDRPRGRAPGSVLSRRSSRSSSPSSSSSSSAFPETMHGRKSGRTRTAAFASSVSPTRWRRSCWHRCWPRPRHQGVGLRSSASSRSSPSAGVARAPTAAACWCCSPGWVRSWCRTGLRRVSAIRVALAATAVLGVALIVVAVDAGLGGSRRVTDCGGGRAFQPGR